MMEVAEVKNFNITFFVKEWATRKQKQRDVIFLKMYIVQILVVTCSRICQENYFPLLLWTNNNSTSF